MDDLPADTDATGRATTVMAVPVAVASPLGIEREPVPGYRRCALLLGAGWFGTGIAIGISDLPLRYLLKDHLGLSATALALFFTLANIPIYLKLPAGILSDSFPLFGTRRRHYLIFSLLAGGLCWLLLGVVPRTFGTLVWTYILLNLFLVLTSATLGGLMVEVGLRYGATGRLSAQRMAIGRSGMITGPLGGVLVSRPFLLAMGLSAALHFALVPVFWRWLREKPVARPESRAVTEAWRQCKILFRSRTLWSAAGLVVLVIASPGFGTPLFYYQTGTLKFTPTFIGSLEIVGGGFGLLGAGLYHLVCPRWNLRQLLAASILVHALGTLTFLAYRSAPAAVVITAIGGLTQTLAVLPLYDLAARATPAGGEALGYAVMMSVWNLTSALSNLFGAYLYDRYNLTVLHLVWLNAGTTALVLLAVPFLPAVLMMRRDGET